MEIEVIVEVIEAEVTEVTEVIEVAASVEQDDIMMTSILNH